LSLWVRSDSLQLFFYPLATAVFSSTAETAQRKMSISIESPIVFLYSKDSAFHLNTDKVKTETVQRDPAMRFTASSPSNHVGKRKSRGRKLIPTVEGDKVIAERFRTKLCRNYLQHPDRPCPYEDRCMFAHGDHELRTATQNIADGLMNEDEIRLFKQKEKLLVPYDEFNRNHVAPWLSQAGAFSFSGSLEAMHSPPPSTSTLSTHPSKTALSVGAPMAPPRLSTKGSIAVRLPSSPFRSGQCTIQVGPPATQPHFLLLDVGRINNAEKEIEDSLTRASRISSLSSDRTSPYGSSVVSVTSEGTQILPLHHGLPDHQGQFSSSRSRRSQVQREVVSACQESMSEALDPDRAFSPGLSRSYAASGGGVVSRYRHDPYRWRAIESFYL
jgi:hypothetical protein